MEQPSSFASSPRSAPGSAVASLTLGLLSFLFSCFTGIPAIVLGFIALRSISPGGPGRGFAITGIVTGFLSLALLAFLFFVGVLGGITGAAKTSSGTKGDGTTVPASSQPRIPSSGTAPTENSSAKEPPRNGVGSSIQTEYFKITLNSCRIVDRISTGNEFADPEPSPGNQYLVINATFKCTDTESRMPEEGSVFISYQGKDYEFDDTESIMLEGWGLILDQLNPLTSKTTNIVYKIPLEIKGPVYWVPGRNYKNLRFFCGEIE
ncbi:MAG: DUF4190 domain-containing protein [Verrucomicrobia bacterium]|nr:DUF4190 domain-containing protein [Verrucomicrobiota bacterium]